MARFGFWFQCSLVALSVIASACNDFSTNVASGATVTSWTQYQGDAGHTGHIPITVAPSSIQPLWTKSATSLGQNSLIPGAVTDGQHVYISGITGSGGIDQVLSLEPSSGNVLWSASYVPYSSSLSAPATGNGMVYVHQWGHSGISGGNPSQYPYVNGIDAATGNKVFSTSHSGQWSSGSRPTVAGNQVFAAGGYYGGLDGYNATTGARQWFANVNQQYGWIPAADSSCVYVYMGSASASPGPNQGSFYAFDRTTGSKLYTVINPDDTFTLYNGTVFLGGQNDAITLTRGSAGATLACFDLIQHSVQWRTSGNYTGSLAIDDGWIFANNGKKVDVLSEATGSVSGSWTTPSGQDLKGNMLVTDNIIFAQTQSTTYAIDRNTLATVWATNTVGDLALGDGLLLISASGSLTAFGVPEPSTVSLLCMAALGFLAFAWQRQKRHRKSVR
jgi:hypothetical protein